MKQTPSTFFVASMGIILVAGVLYSGIRKSRLMLQEQLLNDEGLVPPENSELNLPKRHTISEYFAYVDVTDIPYPPHPQNTTDKWHSTGTSPDELIQLMKRFRTLMRVVRDRDGDMEPSHDYWEEYWHKRDHRKLFLNRRNTSWA